MLRITGRKSERNEKFFRGIKLRSGIFLLGDVHAVACGSKIEGAPSFDASRIYMIM